MNAPLVKMAASERARRLADTLALFVAGALALATLTAIGGGAAWAALT